MQSSASALLAALNTIFRSVVKPRVEESGGHIVKLLGDGALVEFQSAYAALTCAGAIQHQMHNTPPPYTYGERFVFSHGNSCRR